MSVASLELLFGLILLVFGIGFGTYQWVAALLSGAPAALGIIMFAAMPILIGLQLLLAFLAYDIAGVPRRTIASELPDTLVNND